MAVKKFPIRELFDSLPPLLSWNEAFIASHMSAHGLIGMDRMKARLSDELYKHFVMAEYAVFSYDTAIAWRVQGEWYVNGTYYSRTTSYHQRLVMEALPKADIEFKLL